MLNAAGMPADFYNVHDDLYVTGRPVRPTEGGTSQQNQPGERAPLRGSADDAQANRRAASGCTERHYATPVFTDSAQRRFSTQFSTQRGSAATLRWGIYWSRPPTGRIGQSVPLVFQAGHAGSIPSPALWFPTQAFRVSGGRWMVRWRSIASDIPPTVRCQSRTIRSGPSLST